MKSVRSVRAHIKLLSTNAGGRRSAIASGYFPTVKFGDRYADARVELVGCNTLAPGDGCEAILTFALDQPDDSTRAGSAFDLTEGGRKVGEGMITGSIA